MIPKIIHYCWFGKGEKPAVFKKCLESWKQYAPDYEIIEWNEGNTDIYEYTFAEDAYQAKKYAFVSDVVRLKTVYENGGIYLDTDVELCAPIEEYLNNDFFLFFSNATQIATGLGFGAIKNHPLIKAMLDDYNNQEFLKDNLGSITCPILNTASILEYLKSFVANNTTQYLMGGAFFSSSVYEKIAFHHDEFSWKSDEQKKALRFAKKKLKCKRIRKIIRSHYIFDWFDKHELYRLKNVYLFAVYDFIDYGVVYWIYKLIHKKR